MHESVPRYDGGVLLRGLWEERDGAPVRNFCQFARARSSLHTLTCSFQRPPLPKLFLVVLRRSLHHPLSIDTSLSPSLSLPLGEREFPSSPADLDSRTTGLQQSFLIDVRRGGGMMQRGGRVLPENIRGAPHQKSRERGHEMSEQYALCRPPNAKL